MSETRSQARQHVTEQQLSTLVTMLKTVQEQQAKQEQFSKEHKADLEKLSRDHKTDLEKVVNTQREQAERQEDLARVQETKWLQFIEKADRRCQQIELKQSEAETAVCALQRDVSSMKDILHNRISSAEEGLEGLQVTQEQLTTELHTTKTAIMQELMGELEERFATKAQLDSEVSKAKAAQSLRPTAPAFVPSHYSTPGSHEMSTVGGGAGPNLQKPPPFDGRSPWDAYKLQFEMLATVNHWSDAEKATYLAVSLRGSALTVLTKISPDRRGEYATLIAALDKRYGSAHQTDLNRAKLKGRIRKREESLPELAEDVERLARLAYPDASAEMLEVLAKDQFIDALTDEDFRLRIRQNKPETLRNALEQALELESIQLANRQRTKTVREVQLESGCTLPVNRAGLDEGSLQTLQSILDAVHQCSSTRRSSGGKQSTHSRGRGLGRKKIYCWNCRKEGHIQRHCTEKKQNQRNSERAGAPEKRADAERPNTQEQSGNGQ